MESPQLLIDEMHLLQPKWTAIEWHRTYQFLLKVSFGGGTRVTHVYKKRKGRYVFSHVERITYEEYIRKYCSDLAIHGWHKDYKSLTACGLNWIYGRARQSKRPLRMSYSFSKVEVTCKRCLKSKNLRIEEAND